MAAVAAGDEDDRDSDAPKPARFGHSRGLFEQWFQASPKPADKRPVKNDKAPGTKAEKMSAPVPTHGDKETSINEEPARGRSAEEADWLRRVAVCTELKRIAEETNDTDLLRRAEELDARAWKIYSQRAQIGASTNLSPSEGSTLERDGTPGSDLGARPSEGVAGNKGNKNLRGRTASLEVKP
jgi:hypothetical protein